MLEVYFKPYKDFEVWKHSSGIVYMQHELIAPCKYLYQVLYVEKQSQCQGDGVRDQGL